MCPRRSRRRVRSRAPPPRASAGPSPRGGPATKNASASTSRMRRSGTGTLRGSRTRRRRVCLEDLLEDLAPLRQRVERQSVHLVVRAPQHAAVPTWFGGDMPRGFLDEADLVDLRERQGVRRVRVTHDERVTGELDEAEIPQRGAAVEGQLPAVLRGARPRREQAEPQDEPGPHAGFAPSLGVPCPSLPRLRFRAFSRLRLRALPCVPRKILPRLLRRSPLPMESSGVSGQGSGVRSRYPVTSCLRASGDAGTAPPRRASPRGVPCARGPGRRTPAPS